MSLKGRTMLLTRDPAHSREFIAGAERLGAKVIPFPTITIAPPESWSDCDRAIASIGDFAAVLFTSANAVRWFCRRFRSAGCSPEGLLRAAVFAVGPQTAEEAERRGLRVTAVPERFSAAGLARLMGDRPLRGARVLLPQGNRARDELAGTLHARGARVEQVVVYRTLESVPSGAEEVWSLLERGMIDVVVFASPSAAEGFARIYPAARLGALNGRSAVAAIGPTTARRLEEMGWSPSIVAETSTLSGILRGIESHFE